jgi:hypothetical protein
LRERVGVPPRARQACVGAAPTTEPKGERAERRRSAQHFHSAESCETGSDAPVSKTIQCAVTESYRRQQQRRGEEGVLTCLREHQALHVLRRRLLSREVVKRHGGLRRRVHHLRRQVHHLYAATRPCIELRVAATTDPLGTALYRATHRGCVRYCFLTPSPLCRPSSGFERSPVSHPRRRVKRRDSQG